MQIKYFTALFLLIFIFQNNAISQEQLVHKRRWYVNEDGDFFTNKHLPVYIRLSHSPEENAPSYLLKSKSSAKYTNPMYFDAEGYNSLRSPSAVDTVTKRTVLPKQDIRFEVYADGIAPTTKINFSNARKYISNKKTVFWGKSLTISLAATDDISGVADIYYSINGENYHKYNGIINMSAEGEYSLKYYAVDNVGNVEMACESVFSVDLTPPTTNYHVKGDIINGVISPKAQIVLTAEDAMSGVAKIMYSLNNSEPKLYTKSIDFSRLKGGKVKLKFFSVDKVGNSEQNATVKKQKNEYEVFLDKSGPSSAAIIIGDKYQSKRLFISNRSRIELSASDNKISVKQINYSVNNKTKNKFYSEPFGLDYVKNGFYRVNFAATDSFGNVGKNQELVVFLDNIPPMSKIKIGERKFVYGKKIMITGNTNIHIEAMDLGSQVKEIEYSIDNSEFHKGYEFQINSHGKHIIKYRAIDNVNNKEELKSIEVIVDEKPPEIYVVHSTKSMGKRLKNGEYYPVYPANSTLFLGATDEISGVSEFIYSVNGNSEINYINNPYISYKLPLVESGFYSVKIVVTDKLGNQAEKLVEFFAQERI